MKLQTNKSTQLLLGWVGIFIAWWQKGEGKVSNSDGKNRFQSHCKSIWLAIQTGKFSIRLLWNMDSVAQKITSRTLALDYKTLKLKEALNQTKYIFPVSKHSLICIQKFKLSCRTLTKKIDLLSRIVPHVKMKKNQTAIVELKMCWTVPEVVVTMECGK